MVQQARAESTRRAILDASVGVFEEAGYWNASLTEVMDRAGVSKGAFYYHFPTKSALASALIEDSDAIVNCIAQAVWDSSPTATVLEDLIRAAFAVGDCARFDKRIRMGIRLLQALGTEQVNHRRVERQRAFLAAAVNRAIEQGDIRPEASVSDLSYSLWVALLGNHLLAESAGEDLIAGLARVLRTTLSGVCAVRAAPFFGHLVDRLELQYALQTAEQQV